MATKERALGGGWRGRGLGIVLSAAVLVATGCARPSDERATATPLHIVARDFAYQSPDTIPTGPIRLTFHNDGPSYHHVQIVRLTQDIDYSDVADSLPTTGVLPSWMVPVGGAEGADSIARDVTLELNLPPGRYLLLCRITTSTNQLHYRLGMFRPLVVSARDARDEVTSIAADTIVRLRDHAIEGADSLRTGLWRFRVVNDGPQEHHAAIARLADGRTLDDVINAKPGPTPVFDVLGGTAGLGTGQENVLELRLRPGRYVCLCFVRDAATGREHYQMGMVRALTVLE
jgi:hypothetical protein